MLCCENKEKQIFLLTYNSMLKTEVRDKIKNKNFKNCEVHSYHSLVTNYYDNSGYDDEHISKIIKNDNKLSKDLWNKGISNKNFKMLYKQVGYPKTILYSLDETLKQQYIKTRCQL